MDSRIVCTLDPAVLRREYAKAHGVKISLAETQHVEYLHCQACDLYYFLPAQAGDADFYRQLQTIPWYYQSEKQEYRMAASRIRAADAVLEVGAGKGAFSKHIQCRTYAGLETSPDAILIAAENGIGLVQENLETHAAGNRGRYDVVCSFQVLEHVEDPRSFLASARCCLRSGGLLLVSVPSEDSFAAIDYWDVLNMPPHHLTRWTDRCLVSVARLIDMELVAIEHEPLGDGHVRPFVRRVAEYGFAKKFRQEPVLLDPFLRRWPVRLVSNAMASLMKYAFYLAELKPRGHAVLAIYRCP